jgi:hypothetical protein
MASNKGGANRALKNSSNFRKYNRLVRETVYHRIKNGVEVETIKPPVWWNAIKKAVPPSVIQYQDYSNENIKFKFDTVFPKYNEAWKEAGHEPDLEWDSMYGKPTSFLLRLQIRLIQEGLPIHEAYEKAFDALKKEKEDIDMKMELEREWLEQREYDLGKQSNPWDTKDEVEGVDTNEDDGIEAETSSFSKLLLAAKNRKKMGKMEAMALEGEGDSRFPPPPLLLSSPPPPPPPPSLSAPTP